MVTEAVLAKMEEIEAQWEAGLSPRYWDLVISLVGEGMWLEFGVFQGASLRFLAGRTVGKVYGFDSFEGLPEVWDGNPVGWFGLREHEVPRFTEGNVEIVRGRFEETLGGFLEGHRGSVGLLHIDCDVYSATDFVLESLEKRLIPGSIVCFDELLGFPDARNHELKAWAEWLVRTGRKAMPFATKTDEWKRISVAFEVLE